MYNLYLPFKTITGFKRFMLRGKEKEIIKVELLALACNLRKKQPESGTFLKFFKFHHYKVAL